MTNTDKFETYYTRLIEVNRKINLTAITERKEVFIKHFEDSLWLAKAIPDVDKAAYKIIDVGTGAGFPGLPLAIEYPQLQVTLADAAEKRLGFLRSLVEELRLENVNIVHARAEELGRKPDFREGFDIATCRAVSKLSTIVEYCAPLIHKNGLFIPLKSAEIADELEAAQNAIRALACKIKEIRSYSLSENMGKRSLVVIEKTSTTPEKYPRKAGTPSKKPL